MTLPSPKRKAIPDRIKVCVLEREVRRLNGWPPDTRLDYDHDPALQLRAINSAGTDYDPAQLDPDYIYVKRDTDHDRKTFTDNGTGRGDITTIAKVKRISKEQEDFRRRVLAKPPGHKRERSGRWPQGRKIQGRNELRRREKL